MFSKCIYQIPFISTASSPIFISFSILSSSDSLLVKILDASIDISFMKLDERFVNKFEIPIESKKNKN